MRSGRMRGCSITPTKRFSGCAALPANPARRAIWLALHALSLLVIFGAALNTMHSMRYMTSLDLYTGSRPV